VIGDDSRARAFVRVARESDTEAVAALINAINELGPGAPVAMTPEVVRRDLICARPKALLRVAEDGGRVVGFATAGLIYDAERAAFAMMLLDLYVEPAFRRRGHARALMAALAAEALREGAACLWWGVDEGDDEATLFYRSIGARSEGMFSGEIIEGAALTRLAGQA
jgi:ribosomal protein S18 acetylase RimI-like enzyme